MDAAKHHLLIGIVVDESTEQNWAAPCCSSRLQGAEQVKNKLRAALAQGKQAVRAACRLCRHGAERAGSGMRG